MYICRKLRLCTYLLQNSFNYLEQMQDKHNNKFKVWMFENTPELRKTVEEYYSREEFVNKCKF